MSDQHIEIGDTYFVTPLQLELLVDVGEENLLKFNLNYSKIV